MIINKDFLTQFQKEHLETILSSSFPFYYTTSAIDGDDLDWMSHTVLQRPESRDKDSDGVNSTYFNLFKEILETFCKKNNIQLNTIFRICVNLTFPTNNTFSLSHVDHEFEHKQLILYLTDNEEAYTCVLENNKEIKIYPKKFKGACFNNNPHYAKLPENNRRIVVVFTFN